jgi:mRNA interferase HigB
VLILNGDYLTARLEDKRLEPARKPAAHWQVVIERSAFPTPNALKQVLGQTDFIGNGRAVFNIGGNKYRLIATVDYKAQALFIHFFGTHAEYDKIDPYTVTTP